MKTANEILKGDPVKSTLFGKFYEKIVLSWLDEKKGFEHLKGKPRIYWGYVKFVEGDGDSALKYNDVLKKTKNEKQFCTPDGIFKKDGKIYIWEAKNWPNWEEARKGKKPLDQLRDVLFSLPFILAARADYRTKIYNIDGILFSWWSKPECSTPEELESLLIDVRALIAPRTFELFYTADVLDECITNQYPWYLEIIKEERARIDTLFKDLLGQATPEIDRKAF